jgi:hypothetical protein
MPVLRYFVFVGGALFALLLVCNAVFPQVPLPTTLKSGSDMPTVRIKSERKWPERVVFDTTMPSLASVNIAPVNVAKVDTKADTTQQTAAGDGQKARAREAFAQMGIGEPKPPTTPSTKVAENVAAKAAEPAAQKVADATAPKAAEQRSEFNRPQPKRKVAKVHPYPSRPMIIVAQQPQSHFGFFDSTW